jgi:hypothetical protein
MHFNPHLSDSRLPPIDVLSKIHEVLDLYAS